MNKTRLITRLAARSAGARTLATILGVLAIAPFALAQQEAVPAQNDVPEQTDVSTPQPPPQPLETPDAESVAGEDYEASEQISEDLSVSFPVDI